MQRLNVRKKQTNPQSFFYNEEKYTDLLDIYRILYLVGHLIFHTPDNQIQPTGVKF